MKEQSVSQSVSRSVSQSVSQSAVSQLVGRLVGRSVSQSVAPRQAVSRSVNNINPLLTTFFSLPVNWLVENIALPMNISFVHFFGRCSVTMHAAVTDMA